MIEATSTSLTPLDAPTRAKASPKSKPDVFAQELERVTRRSHKESRGTGDHAPGSVNDDALELADSDTLPRRDSDAVNGAKQHDVSLPWVTQSQVNLEPTASSRGAELLGGHDRSDRDSLTTGRKNGLHPGSGDGEAKPAENHGRGSARTPAARVAGRASLAGQATPTLGATTSELPPSDDSSQLAGSGSSDRLTAGDATKQPAHASGVQGGNLAAGPADEQATRKPREGDRRRATVARKPLHETNTSRNEAAPAPRGFLGEAREAAHVPERAPSEAQEGWRHSVVAGLNSVGQRQAKANRSGTATQPVADAAVGALPSNAGPQLATGPSQVRQIAPVLKSSEVSNWLPKAQVMVQEGGGVARFEVEVVSGKKATLEVRVADGVMDARLMLDLGDDTALARRLLDDVRAIASGAGLDAGEFAFQHGADREPAREGKGQMQQLALTEAASPASSLRRSTSSGLINIVI